MGGKFREKIYLTIIFPMNEAQEAIKSIIKCSDRLTVHYMINNILGIASIGIIIYMCWWVWEIGWWGLPITMVGIYVFNSFILKIVFGFLNKPIAEKAGENLQFLLYNGNIDSDFYNQISKIKVEHWGDLILKNADLTKVNEN